MGVPLIAQSIQVFGLAGMPEIKSGGNIATLVLDLVQAGALGPGGLEDGDIVVVTSKIVSKSEGRLVKAVDREAAITEETARVVASRGSTRIVETHHGFVMAAAGVDSSNTPIGTVLLLPLDPDESARRIRADLQRGSDCQFGVIVTDTGGRPWRSGLVDIALGAAGIVPFVDYRGRTDAFGNALELTVTAVVDEIAAAADLVKGKLRAIRVAVVRGLAHLVMPVDGPGVRSLIRNSDEDLFRLGTHEALEQGRREAMGTLRNIGSCQCDLPRIS